MVLSPSAPTRRPFSTSARIHGEMNLEDANKTQTTVVQDRIIDPNESFIGSVLVSWLRLRTARRVAQAEAFLLTHDAPHSSIDAGTSSVRFYIFDGQARVICSHQLPFEQSQSIWSSTAS